MSAIESLLEVARAYGAAHDIELSTVSWRVFGDTKKLNALVNGRDLHTKRCEQAMTWFSANWPENTPWPDDIARPENQDTDEASSQVDAA